MKKYLAILFVMGLLNVASQAQSVSTKDGFISISLGVAIPTGDFGDNGANNDEAGFAESGVAMNLINFGYLFSKNIGITAMLTGAAFPLDAQTLGPEPIWSYGTLLVGPLFTIRNNESPTEFDFRLMVGSMSGMIDFDNELGTFEGTGSALAFGAGLRYNVSDLIAISGNLDIISGTAEFDILGSKEDQSMSSANFTVGIAFRLK